MVLEFYLKINKKYPNETHLANGKKNLFYKFSDSEYNIKATQGHGGWCKKGTNS